MLLKCVPSCNPISPYVTNDVFLDFKSLNIINIRMVVSFRLDMSFVNVY